jgi:uncharacterized protein (UPF0333 family)
MTIHRLSYRDGVIFDYSTSPEEQVNAWLQRDSESTIVLPSGEYDITPTAWEAASHTYNLVVNEAGNAALRLLPISETAGNYIVNVQEGISVYKPGGKLFRIPEELDNVVIGGPDSTDTVRIYEIIAYTPGRSPERG